MARAVLAILNELSAFDQAEPLSESEAEAAIEDFVATLRAARRIRDDLALVSDQSLSAIPVGGGGLTLAAFLERRSGRHRELLRFIRILRNHAPIASAPSMSIPDDGEEFSYDTRSATGLGLAASMRQLATSFCPEKWPDPTVRVTRRWLVEEGEEVVVREEEMVAVHASTATHVAEHREFLLEAMLPRPITGEAIWVDRERLFPCLEFLPRVRAQLLAMAAGSRELENAFLRLRQLDEAVGEWEPAESAHPAWKSRVTPEHEQRKRLCMYIDLDGEQRCFDLHARFNPAPGRIHFRLAPEQSRGLIVAHIGRKLAI